MLLPKHTVHFLRKPDFTASLWREVLKTRSLWRITLETSLYHQRMNYLPAIKPGKPGSKLLISVSLSNSVSGSLCHEVAHNTHEVKSDTNDVWMIVLEEVGN